MPSYNRSTLIAKTITNVFEQTHANIELIVIDDGSTDDTKEILNNFSDSRLKYFYQSNAGACVARNHGLQVASGDYIMFMDSDDLMDPIKIEEQVQALENSDAPFAICDFTFVHDNTEEIVYNNGNLHENIINFKSPFIMTTLMRKESIPKSLIWNKQLQRQQDVDFLFRYFTLHDKWEYTPGDFCKYIQHEHGRISNSYNMGLQIHELKKSMIDFFANHDDLIPEKNKNICTLYCKTLDSVKLKEFSRDYGLLFEKIISLKNNGEKYVIFGKGSMGKTIFSLLNEQVITFIDSTSEKVGQEIQKEEVYSAKILENLEYDKVLVSLLGRKRPVIRHLTTLFNIPENKILTFEDNE